jgi:three-Cys-motif partner protein
MVNAINIIEDDLIISEVGPWSQRKYDLVKYYTTMFATSMKYEWDCRVYIDLFSGPGYSRIRGTNDIIPASPLLALNINDPFDKYIFSDINQDKIQALESRVCKSFPSMDTDFINCNVNESIDRILDHVPRGSTSNKVLTFCLVDPYSIGNLHFSTLERISSRIYVDFMVLIPSRMDAHRNLRYYFRRDNNKVERFLNDPNWRDRWNTEKSTGLNFGEFIVQQFNNKMASLGFLPLNGDEFVPVYETGTQRLLYHLAFYSKKELGKKFWIDSIRGTDPQQNLF